MSVIFLSIYNLINNNLFQIVSNTEVWDIRTFHLLKTVPILNQCSIVFSPVTTAIYAFALEQEMDDGDSTFDTSFKTVDAIDYSSISKSSFSLYLCYIYVRKQMSCQHDFPIL